MGGVLFPELIWHCCPVSPNIPQIDFELIYFECDVDSAVVESTWENVCVCVKDFFGICV